MRKNLNSTCRTNIMDGLVDAFFHAAGIIITYTTLPHTSTLNEMQASRHIQFES